MTKAALRALDGLDGWTRQRSNKRSVLVLPSTCTGQPNKYALRVVDELLAAGVVGPLENVGEKYRVALV